MARYLKHLDWKLVAFVLLACYIVPGILIGGLMVVFKDSLSPGGLQVANYLIAVVGFLVPPVTAGYLAARYARQVALFHVFFIGLLGALISLLAFRTTPRAMVLYALASIALAAFGGCIRLSWQKRG